ncbi:MAG: hypothetical protein HUJ25_15875 [Crocinitomicaceae bacterium]|nr:hypothetical protein [Crocinitomicaceae bacterium]
MVLIWKGAGILVPILWFICGWITSYWFEDTRLGNGAFMGWTLLWSSIPVLLLALLLRSMGKQEQSLEPGEIPQKKRHEFFWLPVWVWGAGFLIGGLFLILTSPDETESEEETVSNEELELERLVGEKTVNFWNPTDETIAMTCTYVEDGEVRLSDSIPAKYVHYATLDADKYYVNFEQHEIEITVHGEQVTDTNSYDQGWFILDPNIDLLLVDVSEVCNAKIVRDEIRAIDWTKKVRERYEGGQLIEPRLDASTKNIKYRVMDPGFTLPLKKGTNETVFSLIPIDRRSEATDVYLDSMVIAICF